MTEIPLPVKAYAYSRFSSRAQAEGDSLRRQLHAAFEYAEKHGLELDTSLRDLGLSAFTGANRIKGALKSFKDRVATGEVERGSYLLIDSFDRLSREAVPIATLSLLEIATAGINVVTLNDERVFGANAGMPDLMMAVLELERSHRESAEKGRKVAEAHGESKKLAREEGRIWHRSGPTWLRFDEDCKTFKPIPEKVEVVRRIFDLIEGGFGTTAIAVRLNEEKVPTPRGRNGGWHHSAVLEIAKSRAVIGEYQPRFARGGNRATGRPTDGDPIVGYYGVPVVAEDQFHRVQAIIASRRPGQGRGANTKEFTNLFIGIGVCGECGGRIGMHSASKHPRWKRAPVLRCNNAIRGAASEARPTTICTNRKRFAYPALEAAVIRHVKDFALPETRRRDTQADRLALTIAQRDDLEQKVENLLDLLEGGDVRLKARYEQRVAELEAKEAELGKLSADEKQAQASVPLKARQAVLERLIEKLATVGGNELYELRAAVSKGVRDIVDMIDFDPTGDVRVIVAGGARAYRFRDGAFVDSVDLTGIINSPDTSRLVWDARHERSADGKTWHGAMVRVTTNNQQIRAGLTGNDSGQLAKLDALMGDEAS